LLFAIPATPEVAPVALTRFGINHLVDIDAAAMHTAWIRPPTLLFKELHCGQFIRASEGNLCDYAGLR